ncbi:ABC transporter permease [Calycomorphotria hydatis]|uniref:ABC-2 type transporter n=1 Tax=Calycomorphotria hydatis TaxID=2528027 RepID=A0A517TD21_9PLAN|nr:ABC-2 family transporter protein [Calycomorphotria hydatis]QDT66273.1 hypothetical protein V22_35380 [Calycomorphotria hydatis]
MNAAMRTNWLILRTSIEERLVYRGDFIFATFVRFLPIVTQIFLWGAIYGVTRDSGQDHSINGYTYPDMVAYYLLAMVGRAFSSMPGLSTGIARDVRDGTIKKYLTQPVDMLGYLFWYRVAHKLVYYLMAIGPFVVVFWLCRSYLPGWPSVGIIAMWVASLVLAFLIGFLLEALIGLVSFWFLEVSSLMFIYMMFNFFLSGHMIPLDWLPAPINTWVQLLPLKYLAYTPAAIMLGKYTLSQAAFEVSIGLMWVIILFAANRYVYARGVDRYSAFGG